MTCGLSCERGIIFRKFPQVRKEAGVPKSLIRKKTVKPGKTAPAGTDPDRRDCFDEFLQGVPAFLHAGDDALQAVKSRLVRRHIRQGKAVYLTGDPVSELYICESGRVEISKTDEQGRRLTLWYINPGEVFCVPSVLTGSAIADAEAAEDTSLYCLAKDDFEGLLERHPELAVGLLKCLAGRVRSYSRSVDSVAFSPASGRIAAILLAHKNGGSTCSLSRNEIAALAGTCGETVSRTLGKFKDEGFVDTDLRSIAIRDAEGLRKRYRVDK
jgi:CRP/FNR family transcriptional regulator